jgi:hypothetical protein
MFDFAKPMQGFCHFNPALEVGMECNVVWVSIDARSYVYDATSVGSCFPYASGFSAMKVCKIHARDFHARDLLSFFEW